MAKNNEQHYRELLITLEYLLNYADENNPATTIGICEFARDEYGLAFNKNTLKGNDIDRRRIGRLLRYLSEQDNLPFILETTNGGKYYVDKKNGLFKEQTARLLAAIKNDKYTKEDDFHHLFECILNAFATSEHNKAEIIDEYALLVKGTKKLDKETIRKIHYLEQAYKENRCIHIITKKGDALFKVYFIKEFGNKLYVFLIPVSFNALPKNKGYIFDTVDRIQIPQGGEKDVLDVDIAQQSIDSLFEMANPGLIARYGSLQEMIKEKIMPLSENAKFVSFYFDLKNRDVLKNSYEDFFKETFRYQETNVVDGLENTMDELFKGIENWNIVSVDDPKEPKYGLVSVSVDNDAFLSWSLSDPYNNARECIADLITIIRPNSLKQNIAEYYYVKLLSHYKDLTDEQKNNLFNALLK